VDAFFSFLTVATIGVLALLALVLVLLAIPQTRLKSTLTELVAWGGFLGASGLIVSPVDVMPDILPIVGWTDDIGYALLALVCGYIGWTQRRRRLTSPAADRPLPLSFVRECLHLWQGWRAMRTRPSR
jgi:uncharacterized membrane protein YkvA (DUF1232 family)